MNSTRQTLRNDIDDFKLSLEPFCIAAGCSPVNKYINSLLFIELK